VAYIAADQHIHELYVSIGGGWAEADLTALGLGVSVADDSPLAGYSWTDAFGPKQVAYIGVDRHIHQLEVQFGNWQDFDLTRLATNNPDYPLPAPAAGTPLTGYGLSANGSRHVIYMGIDGVMAEIVQIASHPWRYFFPLGLPPGQLAPGPAAGSPLVGFTFDAASPPPEEVGYIDDDGHVHELHSHPQYCIPFGYCVWQPVDLTVSSLGPPPG
jgi:hypothetical protein